MSPHAEPAAPSTAAGSALDPLPAYDLSALDRLPGIRALLQVEERGLALDLGCGVGFLTSRVFGARRLVCIDLHEPNLRYFRERMATAAREPLCVVARATALPFREEAFRYVLCSEVLEHVEDDDAAVGEISRVLAPDGRAVITVPYSGFGFTSFLELCGIPTVHGQPGPEHHVRPGYDGGSLARLLASHGLRIEEERYYFRFFTRVLADVVSLGHLLYQRLVHGRRSWSWSDAVLAEGRGTFRLYARVFPLLWALSRLDRVLGRCRGFGLMASVRRDARADR